MPCPRRPPAPVLAAALLALRATAPAVTLTDLGAALRLTTSELTVTVQKAPLHITIDDGTTTLLDEAADPGTGSLAYFRGTDEFRVQAFAAYTQTGSGVAIDATTTEGSTAGVALEFPADGTVRVDLTPPTPATVTETAETFVAPAGDRYYGLTERLITDDPNHVASERSPQAVGSLDRRGEVVNMSVAATIAIYTPFLHGSRGWGLFVDGPMEGRFDLASTASDRWSMRFNFDPQAQGFRYWVFHGPGHATILDRYTALTGRPWLPPRWVYRHMRWRDEHASGPTAVLDGVPMNAALVEDVTMYESLGFPAPGWYNFDRPWTPGIAGGCPSPGFDRFAFDPVRFPNAAQMIASLAARGTRTIVFNAPWACGDPMDPATNAYEATLGGYYAPGSPDHIDFTNPAALSWWQDKLGAFVTAMGISGFKLDRGDETVPSAETDIYSDGRSGLQLHNDYPRLYVKAYHDRLQAIVPDDWVTMTRPGYAGSQAFGVYWGGDITGANAFGTGAGTDKGLRSAIISLQRLAFMGFPNWGTDTGGYYQFKQRDVFARWLEFSALCPLMEIGGGKSILDPTGGPHAPWAMPTSPTYDPQMIDVYRYFTWLHHELVPYTYSEAVRANGTGHPIATPLVFDYPDDPAVGDLWQEYLYGPWLLVAPVWQDGARTTDVYLPAGDWTSYWNDFERHTGPLSLSAVDVPLDRIPLYVKLGAILPLEVVNNVTGHGGTASTGRLTLDLYPHLSSSYDLRERTETITIASDKLGAFGDAATVTVTTGPATRSYLLRVKTNFRPASVTLDGTPLSQQGSETAFDAAASGWLYVAAERRALVKYDTTGTAATVVLAPPDPLLCGNGTLDAGEDCDDGNATGGDGCSAACQLECGNGVVDPGEACEPTVTGAPTPACCSPTTCRIEDADLDGVCDAVDRCPDVPDPAQTDSDGDGLGDACDACDVVTAGQQAWLAARLLARRVNDPRPTNDGLRIRGRFTMATGSFTVDPRANGARVQVHAATGMPLVDVALPPGPFAGTGPGWLRTNGPTTYTFRDRNPGGTGGIVRVTLRDRGGGTVDVAITGRGAPFAIAPSDVPLRVTVVLGGTAASRAGECGDMSFPSCRVNVRGTRIVCS